MTSSPRATVDTWWTAMKDRDLAVLHDITMVDYIASGGPDVRSLGRDAFLEGAREFFNAGQIDEWTLSDVEIRTLGDVAIVSYLWQESGTFGEQHFRLDGVATDVLALVNGAWRYQAHHVSMRPGGEPAD
jgi:ketosteroid isomerase-like protein